MLTEDTTGKLPLKIRHQSIAGDPSIMLKILPIMLCCTAQKFYPIIFKLYASFPMLCY